MSIDETNTIQKRLTVLRTRRQLLRQMALAGATLPAAVTLLAACGGDEDDPTATATAPADPTATSGGGTEPTATVVTEEPTASVAGEATPTGAMEEPTATEAPAEPSPTEGMAEVTELYGLPIEPAQHEGGTVVWGAGWLNAGFMLSGNYPRQTFEAPVELHPETYEPMPLLAESWEVSDDGQEWTFVIREGVTFHDGEVLDAEDVAFTIRYLAAISYAAASINSSEAEVADPSTLVLRFPTPQFNVAFDLELIGVKPAHLLAGDLDLELEAEDLTGIVMEHPANTGLDPSVVIGTGPFRFVEVVDGDFERLERYDGYWRGAPHLDEIIRKIVTSQDQYPALINTGALDLAGTGSFSTLDPAQVEQFDQDVANVYEYDGPTTTSLVFNLLPEVPFFQDARVRQALLYGTDRETLVESVLYGYGEVPLTFTAFETSYDPDGITAQYAYDPEQAAALLDEAGWVVGADGVREKDGQRLAFRILVNSGYTSNVATATILQEAWRPLGVELELDVLEESGFWGTWESKDWDVMIHWPSSMQLIPWWSFGCEFHGFGFCDEELEGLMAAAAAESDPEARRQALTEMHNSIMEVVPYVPLYRERGLTVVSRRLHNVYPMPIDNYGWNAHTWWVDG